VRGLQLRSKVKGKRAKVFSYCELGRVEQSPTRKYCSMAIIESFIAKHNLELERY
jgi:hypothetical protein